jgi:hypothetical protein
MTYFVFAMQIKLMKFPVRTGFNLNLFKVDVLWKQYISYHYDKKDSQENNPSEV